MRASVAVRTPAPRPAMRRANRRACRIVCEATDNPKVPEGLVAPPPPVPLPPEMEARRQELAKAAALEAKLKVQAAKFVLNMAGDAFSAFKEREAIDGTDDAEFGLVVSDGRDFISAKNSLWLVRA